MAEHNSTASSSFFACYLLRSLNPRFRNSTYIGFTVNPKRRIRQHNGEISSGARSTKLKRPWEMILCVHGFPTNTHALQFEWAWQHPFQSVAVREAAGILKPARGPLGKIALLFTMLNLSEWKSLNLTVNVLSTRNLPMTNGCPSLPPHMHVKVGPLEDLPCYQVNFQISNEHENGSDSDCQDDDANQEDGYDYEGEDNDNEYEKCWKRDILPAVHSNYEPAKESSCMPPRVLAEISNTIGRLSCDGPSRKPNRQGSSKQRNPCKDARQAPNSSISIANGSGSELRRGKCNTLMPESNHGLCRKPSTEEYECSALSQKDNGLHSTRPLPLLEAGLAESFQDKPQYSSSQKDNQMHSAKVLSIPRKDFAQSSKYKTLDMPSKSSNDDLLDISQFSPLWSPSPAPTNDCNIMRGTDILCEDSMKKLRCSLEFSPTLKSRIMSSVEHMFSPHASSDADELGTALVNDLFTDSKPCYRKKITIRAEESIPKASLPGRKPIVIDLTDSPN